MKNVKVLLFKILPTMSESKGTAQSMLSHMVPVILSCCLLKTPLIQEEEERKNNPPGNLLNEYLINDKCTLLSSFVFAFTRKQLRAS